MSSAHASASASASAGFPIVGLLGVAFIILKLTGHIAWSWFWVLAPFWIPMGVILAVAILVGVLAVAGSGQKRRR